ncbi:MAG: hypothetical protein EPO06_10465 [Burkholderiaceae bacterium]|nr:MAG: hypothetical protein EPO06_10465 [Burkholderiaceae bacterium]
MKKISPSFYRARRQHGVVLLIALIVLIAMTLGGLALMRSVEGNSLISGNLAFKKAALQSGDVGSEAALTELSTIVAASADAQYPAGCTPASSYPNACRYYPTILPLNTDGTPQAPDGTAINWNNIQSTTVSGNTVRYVVERMCQGTLPISDISASCVVDAAGGGGSNVMGNSSFTNAASVYYRITVRIDGPRSTSSFSQVIVSY